MSNDDLASLLRGMGPIGRPLEEFTNAKPSDSWWDVGVRRGGAAETWTVERIGRHVYTFCLED